MASMMVSLSRVLRVPPKDLVPYSLLLFKPKTFKHVSIVEDGVKIGVKGKNYYIKCNDKEVISFMKEYLSSGATGIEPILEVISLCSIISKTSEFRNLL